jgi:chemotaxis protein MotA
LAATNARHLGAGQGLALGPQRLKVITEADSEIYQVVRRVILSSLRNQPQPIVLETARTAISPANQPPFTEVFEGLRAK